MNSNSAAFPRQSLRQGGGQSQDNDFDYLESGANGLTKREYFAIKAMQGLLSGTTNQTNMNTIHAVTELAVTYADELLKRLQ